MERFEGLVEDLGEEVLAELVGRSRLARTMAERCEVLKGLGARGVGGGGGLDGRVGGERKGCGSGAS